MKRLRDILNILLKYDPEGYLSAYSDEISLGKDLEPAKLSKDDVAALVELGARWIPASKRIPAGYWVTTW